MSRLDDAGFRALFAGTAVKRIGRERFVRNVLVAIGNAAEPAPELVAAAEARLGDASALVRATALWAYARLVPGSGIRDLMRHDPDPLVQAEIAAITVPV